MKHRLQMILRYAAALFVVIAVFSTLRALSQSDTFSATELTKIRPLAPKGACATYEATFSSPLQETPKAVLDIGKMHFIEGAITRLLDVIKLSPNRYELRLTDPEACRALQERGSASVTITEGKGVDGRPIFPAERTVPARSHR